MIRKIIHIALIGIIFASCEEYYTPEIEDGSSILVVDSHFTNDPNQNFVRLAMTKDFYSSESSEPVIGAKVELIQYFGETTQGIENGDGYFIFPVTPIPEKKYQLRISYMKDTYTSDAVIMPPIPAIDTLYTKHVIAKSYRTASYGSPALIEIPGRQICIDATILPDLEYYRFNWKAVLLWGYTPPVVFPPPLPPWFGWKTLYQAGHFNLAGPKEFSNSDQIVQHEMLSLSYDSRIYLDSAQQTGSGWIVTINQYGIPKESHDFHEMLNKQFSAEGSLFDPVMTQIFGNIHCKTDPEKIVLGFFDLNSFRQYRYYLYLGTGPDNQVNQHRVTTEYDIPDRGYEIGTHPVFWENNY